MSSVVEKRCVKCGRDVSLSKRTKDGGRTVLLRILCGCQPQPATDER